MPRVKIEYIVSFSSEDSDHQASNLLAWEVGKKKWLCGQGEGSCSVVLQLTRAVRISAVHIGSHHAAFVEVLVGRSEKPNEDFQVLVPKSVFLSPAESRRAEPAERVRSFCAEQLLAPARDQRWDRARLVCSQPHNKHCKYGLSFVHIYEPEGAGSAPPPASAVPPRVLALDTLSSDEDEFKPGELFAKHLRLPTFDTQSSTSGTGAQVRQATSQALRNISDSATKLMKTPIAKTINKLQSHAAERAEDRQRDSLLYTDDDDRPHPKIDNVVRRHNDQKSTEDASKRSNKRTEIYNIVNSHKVDERDSKQKFKKDKSGRRDSSEDKYGHSSTKATNSENAQSSVTNAHKKQADDSSVSTGVDSSNNHCTANDLNGNDSRKRPRSDTEQDDKERGGSEPHTALRGVVLVLSGYQNPRRAALRAAALALGARVQRDWGPACTHLVCAFPNTPKLRQVRAAAGGGAVPAARGEWLESCAARGRRLPWRWFATEPRRRRRPPRGEGAGVRGEGGDEPDCDTDEEIERVLRSRKRLKSDDSPRRSRDEAPGPRAAAGSDATSSSRYSIDTVVVEPDAGGAAGADGALPDFFDGYTFLIDEEAMDERFDVQLMRRYIRAYGGVVLEASQLDEDSSVNFVVSTRRGATRGRAVRPAWLWRCHAARAALPPEHFAVAESH